MLTFYSDFDVVVAPDFITAEEAVTKEGNYVVHVQWGLENINQWFGHFVLERFLDPDGEPDASWDFSADEMDYFDEVETGTYYYRVRAEYGAGGGVPVSSGYAPNLDNPELDYAMVTFDSVDEITVEDFVSVKVYDIFGRLVYSGETASFYANSLQNGVYMLQYLTSNGGFKTVKINILK